MFGIDTSSLIILILAPIIFFLPTSIVVFRKVDRAHQIGVFVLNVMCAFMPFFAWLIPLMWAFLAPKRDVLNDD